jgi:hypothetical protein
MQIIVRVETIADWGETDIVELCQFERPIGELAPENVGLSLPDGKELLHKLQQAVIGAQSEEICSFRRFCTRCGRRLFLKDYRKRKVDSGVDPVSWTPILWNRRCSSCRDIATRTRRNSGHR